MSPLENAVIFYLPIWSNILLRTAVTSSCVCVSWLNTQWSFIVINWSDDFEVDLRSVREQNGCRSSTAVSPSGRLKWHLSPSGIRVPHALFILSGGLNCVCVCMWTSSYLLLAHHHSSPPHSASGTYDQTELNATIASITLKTMSLGGAAFKHHLAVYCIADNTA